MNKTNIIIADSQSFTRSGIKSILQEFFTGVVTIKQAKDFSELTNELLDSLPDLLILDYSLTQFSFVADFENLKKKHPSLSVVMLSDIISSDEIFSIINHGISNYILKTADEHELIEATNAALNNRKYLSSHILDVLLERKTSARTSVFDLGKLTCSELDIVKLISQGLTTKEIAHLKKLSYHTIITHRKNIFRKLNISNSSELLIYAMKSGLIDTTEYYI